MLRRSSLDAASIILMLYRPCGAALIVPLTRR